MTSADAAAASVVLIPLGSTEQHGPHLPLDTDTRIASEICRRAAAGLDHVVVAPALPYGASGEHQSFAGTMSIGTAVLTTVLVELARSLRNGPGAIERTVIVNGHGGNHAAVTTAVDQLVAEGHCVAAWWPAIDGADAHAGRTETSLMLAIAPDKVQLERAEAGATEPLAQLLPAMIEGGIAAVAPNGVLGDPAGASADEGERLLAALVDDLRATLTP